MPLNFPLSEEDAARIVEDLDPLPDDDGVDLEDGGKPWQSSFLTSGGLRGCRAALVFYLIETFLPPEDYWMYYILIVHFLSDLDNPMYGFSFIWTALVYFMHAPPCISYLVCIAFEKIFHPGRMVSYRKDKSKISVMHYLGTWILLFTSTSYLQPITLWTPSFGSHFQHITSWILSSLGPNESWTPALFPLLPSLLFVDERGTINAFVPEGARGIMTGILFRLCDVAFPKDLQLLLLLGISVPDTKFTSASIEWAFCAMFWLHYGTPIDVAYGSYLLNNQYIYAAKQFRMFGGGPSVILKRERLGTIWFTTTCIILRLLQPSLEPLTAVALFSLLRFLERFWLSFMEQWTKINAGEFEHQRIEQNSGIRLLRLHCQPLFPRAPIKCDMIHATLTFAPQYIAVSHAWGQTGENKQILINGLPYSVSSNIHSLLQAKRSRWHSRVLWIDSICINQRDDKEKSRQVALMRRIFEEAFSTLGWLGDDAGAKGAIRLIQKISTSNPLQDASLDVSSYISSRQDLDDWAELRKMISNPWFERVWIVQEIAVATHPLLRYGSEEIPWKTFARAITVLSKSHLRHVILPAEGLSQGHFDPHWDNPGLENALIIENLRLCCENSDYLSLKDVLKLGLRFKATLPVDKVYALLGIVAEHDVPPVHPSFSRGGTLEPASENASVVYSYRDVLNSVTNFGLLLGTVTGTRNTRKGRKMTCSPDLAIRHLSRIHKALENAMDNFTHVGNASELDIESIRPDYSDETTATSVYTCVARDLVRKGDTFSFLYYAGIGQSQMLEGLPSWVPNWSGHLESCSLPRPKAKLSRTSKCSDQADVRDGGKKLLYVRGTFVDKISHLFHLSSASVDSSNDVLSKARSIFESQLQNYQKVLKAAQTLCRSLYPTTTSIDDAFWRTVRADTDDDGNRPALKGDLLGWKSWIEGTGALCPIPAKLSSSQTPSSTESTSQFSSSNDNATNTSTELTKACEKYLILNGLRSSSNARFAYLLENEIAPSYSSYRWRPNTYPPTENQEGSFFGFRADRFELEDRVRSFLYSDYPQNAPSGEKRGEGGDTEPEPSKLKKQFTSLFDESEKYFPKYLGRLMDYCIGRQFAITYSGRMGLVPKETKEGDEVVLLGNERWCFVLRPDRGNNTREEYQKGREERKGDSEENRKKESEDSAEGFMLVGEAYFHGLIIDEDEDTMDEGNEERKEDEKENEQWFTLR